MLATSRRQQPLAVLLASSLALGAGFLVPQQAQASSHSDAPLSKLDPQTNLTDVYAFIRTRPGGERVLVCEVSVRPFSEPGDGVLYDAFASDARYSIHITNPTTGGEIQRYDFQFSPVSSAAGAYKNLDTILRYGRGTAVGPIQDVGDVRQNFTQTYSVTRVMGSTSTRLNSTPLLVPPYNTGLATPFYNDMNGRAVSGAVNRMALDKYTFQTTYDLPAVGMGTGGGNTVFCGSREDGFYADTPGIFDLLNSRILGSTLGQAGGGVDGFKGFNVLHYAIVIPLSDLPSLPYTAAFSEGAANGVGVYASVSRPRITLLSTSGDPTPSGPFVQVNRLGNPLFNEVLVAMRDKDRYNRSAPTGDASFSTYALNPEVAVLINAVYGTSFATTGRADLQAVYIPDVIRVDTTTGAARVSGTAGFNRLGFIGGDTLTKSNGNSIPGGWPNGRRFGDDVVDIALTAVASGPTYATVTVVGDNIAANDQVYNQTFPYAATPHSGLRNSKDSGPNVGF
ncbi:DUF4331 domain-containing protein [Armatimonas sp.]|uniref:DUF4331 domain-containing protein n=1 Tax=Armatimonas sp. TaxID=1872638 RepID=UPI00286B97AA|nr:DUF4331 domain-containing protein [Armatimonas sp.]